MKASGRICADRNPLCQMTGGIDMDILNRYLRSRLDLSPIGFQRGHKEGGYFYTQMTFRIDPDMSRNLFRIEDCARRDQPRYKKDVKKSEYQTAVSIGIIEGAHGSTAIVLGQTKNQACRNHIATSSLHFEPTRQIE